VRSDDALISAGEVRELKKRIRKLKRVPGKKTLENEMLAEVAKLVPLAPKRKPVSRAPLLPRDDPQ
jgi:transposase